MAEKRDNSGTLNKNVDKTPANPNWADYKGQCVIDGVGYWISAWVKEYQGSKFMSLSFKPKDEQPYPRTADSIRNQRGPTRDEALGNDLVFKDDDSLPF